MFRPKHAFAVLLISPLLLASDCGGFKQGDFQTPSGPSPFIQLSAVGDVTSLPADGISRVFLVAIISPDSTQKDINFETSAGTLIGGSDGDSSDRTTTVTAVGGEAKVELQSSVERVTARVRASVKEKPEVSSSIEIQFVDPDLQDVIHFTRAPSSAPADGQTASFFTVVISSLISQRTVTFTTTNGSFKENDPNDQSESVTIGAGNEATIALYSPKEIGSALLTATVANTALSTIIEFERALPEVIVLEVSDTTISKTETVDVTAKLQRDVGDVTVGTVVDFSARNEGGASFGTFTQISTSAAATATAPGQATAKFTPGDAAAAGAATLIARTSNGVRGEIAVQIVD